MRVLGDRPVTLQRFPQGVEGEVFYSKNPPRGVPEWVRTVDVTYPSGRSHAQLVVDEPATAVWAVQMNTVTFHPWPVRTSDLDRPDELRIDLDPQPGRGFKDSVAAAHLHVARTVVRRAERAGWAAWAEHEETMNLLAITYLNRLSDLLFILARHANRENGDVLWVPGGER